MCCITMCYTRLLLEFALSTCVRCEDPFYNAIPYACSRPRSVDRERPRIPCDIFSAPVAHDFPSPIRHLAIVVRLIVAGS